MRVQIVSDLHLEFGPVPWEKTDADVVVLAGDIHLGDKGLRWAQKTFKQQAVIYVLGNHEFYREATPRLIEKLQRRADGTNVHVLENQSVSIDGVRFLGCTLWTDFALLNQLDTSIAWAQLAMTDYRKIRISPGYRKIKPAYTIVWHQQSRKWLQREIETAQGEILVVVTHHAPSIHSIPVEIRKHPICAAFASRLDDMIARSQVKLWVHGHIHTADDYTIGTTRILCNPHGYPDEPPRGFDSALTVDL
jgi:Icc-related predicted phosphoesterase